jgi:hypothetical protein
MLRLGWCANVYEKMIAKGRDWEQGSSRARLRARLMGDDYKQQQQ